MNKKKIYTRQVGEYAYYDDRCPYYRMVDIMERDKGVLFGCVFSSKIKYEDTRYIYYSIPFYLMNLGNTVHMYII